MVSLVDLPDLTAAVVRRVLSEREGDEALARASYHGRPGHPVVLGRAHWQAVADAAHGDAGARDYLASNDAALVECGDLASGADVDTRTLGRLLSPTGQLRLSRSSPGISVGWQSQPSPHSEVRVRSVAAPHARQVVRQRLARRPRGPRAWFMLPSRAVALTTAASL